MADDETTPTAAPTAADSSNDTDAKEQTTATEALDANQRELVTEQEKPSQQPDHRAEAAADVATTSATTAATTTATTSGYVLNLSLCLVYWNSGQQALFWKQDLF